MIKQVQIQNFKSVRDLSLELGTLNVFIGENGAGKSNILEAIALASAASDHKLSHEFLASRGIRVTRSIFMRSAFDNTDYKKNIQISCDFFNKIGTIEKINFDIGLTDEEYPKWVTKSNLSDPEFIHDAYINSVLGSVLGSLDDEYIDSLSEDFVKETGLSTKGIGIDEKAITKSALNQFFTNLRSDSEFYNNFKNSIKSKIKNKNLLPIDEQVQNQMSFVPVRFKDFLIYSPEYSSLRIFEKEGQIDPLGINGEGLFKLLKSFYLEAEKHPEKVDRIQALNQLLEIFTWFEAVQVPTDLKLEERYLEVKDKFLDESLGWIDQKSSNEGFLFVLFYYCLFMSENTPAFFAIDNIDASLNPKLCRHLIKNLYVLAQKYGKQVILTTHNPAVLDGLNLTDENQKLFVIYRDDDGATCAKAIEKKAPVAGKAPIKLSEAFMRGYLGGLPEGF